MLSCKNIIIEFMDTLDMEKGGELARTLYSLYNYLHRILIKSDISQNVDGINEVLKHLTGLRETWMKAIEIANAEKEGILVDQYFPAKKEDSDEDEDYDDNKSEDSDEDEDEE